MITHIPGALLGFDAISILRPGTTTDAEGDPNASATAVVTTLRGTWRELTPNEQLLAAQRGQTLHAELAVVPRTDILPGDFVTVRGISYLVAAVDDLRSYRRCSLRTKED